MKFTLSRAALRQGSIRAPMRTVFTTTSVAALLIFGGPAYAQEAGQVAEVVVTGSRLSATGFTAPTPTTVVGVAELQASAKPNLFDAIAQLPSLQGSTGVSTGNGGTSSGTNGLSSFNMRGLGSVRTLTLLDGQRVIPANVSGVADISMFPQLLVNRVDVVTGGASASWGSDAIAGVVNFVTDTRFQGFKYNAQAGETTYHDGKGYTLQAAGGVNLLEDRLHLQSSVEYGREDQIGPNGFGAGEGPGGRNWYKAPGYQTRTIATTPAGVPQITPILSAQDYQFAKFGLITAGPLQGTAFGAGGAPFQFQYGSSGVPSRLATGAVSNCINPFCQGGDLSGNVGNGTSIRGSLDRRVFYSRASFELTPHLEVFASLNLARVATVNTPNPGAFKNANLTIQCDNAFVPAVIRAQCASNNITSFQFGTSNGNFPAAINLHPTRKQQRVVVGAKGDFEALGKNWTWDTYFQDGVSDTLIRAEDITLTPRYNAAIDAVLVNGQVVCRNLTARGAGCVPVNIIGDNPISDAAWRYIAPAAGPIQDSHQTQRAFSFALNGEPVELWAGPLAMAIGVEHRRESYSVKGDPYGDGVSAANPNTAEYPSDPLLNSTLGNNWYAGNFHSGGGKFSVSEVFGELGVPLLNSDTLGKANLQLAGRHTDYSISGKVDTWKVGASYDLPFQGWRLRAVRSRDIRAPNLSELFAAPVVQNVTVINPATGNSVTILNESVGNPNLAAERGTTSEVGVVLRNPSWANGLSLSVDWYRIRVNGQVASLSAQQEVDLCFAGNQVYCADVNLNGTPANPNRVTVRQFNLASTTTEGFDIEASYRLSLDAISLPGDLSVRWLATYVDKFVQQPGVPGQVARDLAGENTGSIPKWKVLWIQNYTLDRLAVNLTERWFSDGVKNNNYIECQANCPAPTVAHPTISDNGMKGALYVDLGLTYKASEKFSVYGKIDNLFNVDPEPVYSNAPNNTGANSSLYDTLGRFYRIGFRGAF